MSAKTFSDVQANTMLSTRMNRKKIACVLRMLSIAVSRNIKPANLVLNVAF